jgi:hypothetical protein
VDLEILKKYSSGELNTRQFLAVHKEAADLLEILHNYLHPGEFVNTVADWPEVRRRSQARDYVVLKTMMLLTPLVLVGGTIYIFRAPHIVLFSGLTWLALFALIAVFQLIHRRQANRSKEGRSVVVVTNDRLMRVWLDGSGDIQFWPLGEQKSEPMEAVPETIRLLLKVDLGETSLN